MFRLGLAVFLVMPALALAQEMPIYAGDANAKYGRVRQVVQPVYPAEALSAGVSGAVTVTGVIAPEGLMQSPTLVADRASSEVFVPSVREAVAFRLFDVPYGNDCMPSADPVSVKVEFEVKEGKPHVYLTYAAPEATPPAWRGAIAANQHPALSFPRSMIRAGAQAVVFSRSEVGPDGRVKTVVARAFPKPGNRSEDLQPFVREVQDTVAKWIYPEEPSKPLRKVCHTVEFNLR